MTRVAVYARFSTQMQRETSIEDQVRLCKERADREHWSVVEIFSDMAMSGASLHRPGLQSLIDCAGRGEFDIVIAEALDRLSRDQADVATLFKRLSFHGVRIVTLSEGDISELHVGLKGTMNQLFLKDLADKTRRGLRGRVEAGLSGGGNSYGYEVVRGLGADGRPVTGERRINEQEAAVVRRIFAEFGDGHSSNAIAKRLNREGIPGPRSQLWRDTAIRGHRARCTGLLNNELYVGRLVWNRLRYIKDPDTGRRVSRLNEQKDWIITEVPELRIVDDTLWERVKERQREIEQDPGVKAIRATRFWEHRRKNHLLTGLLRCGHCGGGFAAVGRDYLACSAARKLETCTQRRSFKRSELEEVILDLLRQRLMQPEAVAQFVKEYATQANDGRASQDAERQRLEGERAQISRRLNGLYDAIADGLRTAGLKEKLDSLEARAAQLDQQLSVPAPSSVRLHPNLGEVYRRKVAALADTLNDTAIRTSALETIRSLISSVTIHEVEDRVTIELEGAITAMIALAQPETGSDLDGSSVNVVAGA